MTLHLKRQLYDLARDEIRTHYDDCGVQIKPWLTLDDVPADATGFLDTFTDFPQRASGPATLQQSSTAYPTAEELLPPSTQREDITASFAADARIPIESRIISTLPAKPDLSIPSVTPKISSSDIPATAPAEPPHTALTIPLPEDGSVADPSEERLARPALREQLLAVFSDPNVSPEDTVLALTRQESRHPSKLKSLFEGLSDEKHDSGAQAEPEADEHFACIHVNGTIIGGNRQKLAARLRSYALSASASSSARSSGKFVPNEPDNGGPHIAPLTLGAAEHRQPAVVTGGVGTTSTTRKDAILESSSMHVLTSPPPSSRARTRLSVAGAARTLSSASLESDMRRSLKSSESLKLAGHGVPEMPSALSAYDKDSVVPFLRSRGPGNRTQSFVVDNKTHTLTHVHRRDVTDDSRDIDADINTLRNVDATVPLDKDKAVRVGAVADGATIHPYLGVDVSADWVKQVEAQRMRKKMTQDLHEGEEHAHIDKLGVGHDDTIAIAPKHYGHAGELVEGCVGSGLDGTANGTTLDATLSPQDNTLVKGAKKVKDGVKKVLFSPFEVVISNALSVP